MADGADRFISKQSGLVLDIKDEKMEDNTPLVIWKDHNGKNQRFTLQPVK